MKLTGRGSDPTSCIRGPQIEPPPLPRLQPHAEKAGVQACIYIYITIRLYDCMYIKPTIAMIIFMAQ